MDTYNYGNTTTYETARQTYTIKNQGLPNEYYECDQRFLFNVDNDLVGAQLGGGTYKSRVYGDMVGPEAYTVNWKIGNSSPDMFKGWNHDVSYIMPYNSNGKPSVLLTKNDFGPYNITLNPCVGADTKYSDKIPFCFILEYDPQTNSSLVLLVSGYEIRYNRSQEYGLSFGNARTMYLYIGVFNHYICKFTCIIKTVGLYSLLPSNNASMEWTDTSSAKEWEIENAYKMRIFIDRILNGPDEYGQDDVYYRIAIDYNNDVSINNSASVEEYYYNVNKMNYVNIIATPENGVEYLYSLGPFIDKITWGVHRPLTNRDYDRDISTGSSMYNLGSPCLIMFKSDAYHIIFNDQNNNNRLNGDVGSIERFFSRGKYNAMDGYRPFGFLILNDSFDPLTPGNRIGIYPYISNFYGRIKIGKMGQNMGIIQDDFHWGSGTSWRFVPNGVYAPHYTITYKGFDEDDDAYTSERPTELGHYIIKADVEEEQFTKATTVTDDFYIIKRDIKNITPWLDDYSTIGPYVYAEGPIPKPTFNGQPEADPDSIIFEYKLKSEDDSAYTTTQPTAAGKYIVRGTIPETEHYNTVVATRYFDIEKAWIRGKVTMKNYYDTDTVLPDPVLTITIGNIDEATVTYKYRKKGTYTYTEEKPTTAGEYYVKVDISETPKYEGQHFEYFFIVQHKEKLDINPYVSMADYYDTTTILPDPVIDNNISGGEVTYSYKPSGAGDVAYTSEKPTAVGHYIVRAVIAETEDYKGATVTSNFSVLHIIKQEIEPTVYLRNFHIDELAELLDDGNVPIPTVTNNLGNAPVKFMYKRKSEPSTEYTNVFPNDIGAYDIKAYIHESDQYLDAECFGTFSVYNVNVNECYGTSVVSMYSNVEVGGVTDIDTKLFTEYKKDDDTIMEKMSMFTIDTDNKYRVLLQGAVDNANVVTVESSISGKISFIIEKCVIMGNRIICYTDSKKSRYESELVIKGTPFSIMPINTEEENNFVIENMPDGHYGFLMVPMYEQYPVTSNGIISSYEYRKIGDNKLYIDNGYIFDVFNSAYYAFPSDIMLYSDDEISITKSGWNVSRSGVCRNILQLPLKYIKDYFPESRIYYETQTIL